MDKWSGSREQAASASQMTDGSIAFSFALVEVTLDDRFSLLPGDCVDILVIINLIIYFPKLMRSTSIT